MFFLKIRHFYFDECDLEGLMKKKRDSEGKMLEVIYDGYFLRKKNYTNKKKVVWI